MVKNSWHQCYSLIQFQMSDLIWTGRDPLLRCQRTVAVLRPWHCCCCHRPLLYTIFTAKLLGCAVKSWIAVWCFSEDVRCVRVRMAYLFLQLLFLYMCVICFPFDLVVIITITSSASSSAIRSNAIVSVVLQIHSASISIFYIAYSFELTYTDIYSKQ